MKKGNPSFGAIKGAGKSSLRARDAHEGGGGKGKRLLNRGMNLKNGNYIAQRDEFGAGAETKAKEDDHALEATWGFPLYSDGSEKLGWLMNMNGSEREDKESGKAVSVVNCYFQCQDGSMFKAQVDFSPYFYLQVKDNLEMEVDAYMRRKHEGAIRNIEIVDKEDLDMKNHLSGQKRKLLKLSFWNVDHLMQVRKEIFPIVNRNRNRNEGTEAYAALAALDKPSTSKAGKERLQDALDSIVDIREHDVPYHVRFAIDTDVRAGHWFMVRAQGGTVSLERREDLLQRAEPRICAFDIETTKLPLQFPNVEYDQVFMISYMIDRQGYLIINREVVSEDVKDFEYSPKPEFEGPFTVFNCADEKATLRCWFDHMRQVQPGIYVTYNGDFFDWPFIETRAEKHGMNMEKEIGFTKNKGGEYTSRCGVHMDCFHWVNRDSYLPQGSRGLKAVTKYKLGFIPVEVDPEDMVRLAAAKPQDMASYSVSDALCTYYLYMTYVHPFIFSLSTIIPMPPDEVLRKGSGTLCEALLMVEAFKANVVAPNKHTSAGERMFNGHLLESETYIGGKVEALESGVFRSDLACKFRTKPDAYQKLIDKLDGDLAYALKNEGKMNVEDVENYEEIKAEILIKLENLRDNPVREENPLIYHLDVAAMYPNIILTNRLQPSAIVNDEDCAACDFNKPGKTCLRRMEWVWRGETYSANRSEYFGLKAQLQSEMFPPAPGNPHGRQRTWNELNSEEKGKLLKERLKKYCQKVYKRVLNKPTAELRHAGVCQRENSFYYDTVRAFRDRRYEYKGLNKVWKNKLDDAKKGGNPVKIAEASDMCVLYDSLQLAHKCILNSFYGYVMRKGARWYSMEMAGVVTHTGANIIKRANELITQVGKPLELDTDGIWCCLPGSFPEEFKFKASNGKTFKMSYPCAMLNVMVAEYNTNDQFATLVDTERHEYATSSEMTIEFEVDGPYKAMVLPASKEEGKLIKKRYAVFNFDGTLAELKGFELKRRGELKLIKVFQAEVFDQFLLGTTLEECYSAVAAVANRWLDLLDTQGTDITDEELIEYISESCVMSKSLDEYEGRKSCAVTCATRLSHFLGDERIRDKGLVCNYVIARFPSGTATSERAVPVAIFSTEPSIARTYLRKWCGSDIGRGGDMNKVPDVRDIVDWDYYKERLGNTIQKIITIPAAMQRVPNPVPRVRHPDWLYRKVQEKEDTHKQVKLDTMFAAAKSKQQQQPAAIGDLEDFGGRVARTTAASPTVGVASSVDITPATAARRAAAAANGVSPASGSKENHPSTTTADGGGGDVAMKDAAAPLPQQEQQPTPDRQESFTGWLAAKKTQWRKRRQERKRQRETAGHGGNDGGGRRQRQRGGGPAVNGVDNLFQQQAEAAAGSFWQIVSVAQTREAGLYKAWTVINGRMHAIPLRIPRQVYVNSSYPPNHPAAVALGPVVKRTLPFGSESHFVYQFSIPEEEYRQRLSELDTVFTGQNMHGVFETGVPLEYNAALQIGCVATLAPSARKRNLGAGFTLQELNMRPVIQYEYFSQSTSLRHMLLHHSVDAVRGRGIFTLHIPGDHVCHIWMVNPASGGQKEVNPSAAERVWEEAAATLREEIPEEVLCLPSCPKFEVAYSRTEAAALKAVSRLLNTIKDRPRGSTVLLLNAPNTAKMLHALPALSDLPYAIMEAGLEDDNYPALSWQGPALKQAARTMQAAGGWLNARLTAARYAHLPLSSFGSDWVIDSCDALFARKLRDEGHLLWVNGEGQPSLASKPKDLAETLVLKEDGKKLELASPGAYRSVCCEIKISHLAVCAVLEAGLLGELEGSALLDDQQGCGPAFKVLKSLAQSWADDAMRRNNMCADTLLRNMYRWLCNPSSKLYDPALKRAVQGLMQKLLLQLVAELQRLGATVVYVDHNSLILSTGKRNLTAAVGYVDYVLDTLRKRELLQYLILEPTKWWHTLLFADRYNYIGVGAQLPHELLEVMATQPGRLAAGEDGLLESLADQLAITRDTLDSPQLDYVCTAKDYLPLVVQDAFMSFITEFVFVPWKEATKAVIAGATQGGSQAAQDTATALEAQTNYLKVALPGRYTDRLLTQVREISVRIGAHDGHPDHAFPQLAGSHLSSEELGTPALAFVKALCHFLALDSAVIDQVTVLRRQLLKLIHCKEFGPDAIYKDPCMTLVLPDVICTTCQGCQDLDLCRDPNIQAKDWRCQACGSQRDVEVIEAQLCGMLGGGDDAYQLQDLKCCKCGTVATNHLQRQCDVCGGHLKNTTQADKKNAMTKVVRNIAEYQEMETLLEMAKWELGEAQ